MRMTFWWGYVQENLLFPGYNIRTTGGFISTCFGLISLAIILEWLKLLQAQHRQKELLVRARQIRSVCPTTNECSNLLYDNRGEVPKNVTFFTRFQLNRLMQDDLITHKKMDYKRLQLILWEVFLWLNLQLLGYLLMLVVMGYNGWLASSVIIGSAIGYFCFGPCFMKINLQNCQVIRETFCAANCGDIDQDGETTPTLQASTSSMTTTDPNETSVCVHHNPVV